MKKLTMGRIRITVGILALCLFPVVTSAQHRVFVIDNEAWRSDVSGRSSTGGAVHFDDCHAFGPPINLLPGGSALIEDIARLLCTTPSPVAVVEFPAAEGVEASYTTWARMLDATGDYNVTLIPELGAPLTLGQSAAFEDLRSGGDLVTWLSILPTIPGEFTLTVRAYDGAGEQVGAEYVVVNGFQMYEVSSRFSIGKIVVENTGSQFFEPKPNVPVDVIALTGYRAGGSPRVVLGVPVVEP